MINVPTWASKTINKNDMYSSTMPKGHPKTHRVWFSKESAQKWCNERNEHSRKIGSKLRCHYKKNPVYTRNKNVYPWLTWEEFPKKK
jgi:hypothetical protein